MERYAKAIAAILSAALVAAQTAIPMSPAAHGWVAVALATLGAVIVYIVPNAPAERIPAVGDIVMLAVDAARPDGPEAVARITEVASTSGGWEVALHLLTSDRQRDRREYLLRPTKQDAAGTYRGCWWPPAGEAGGGRHRD